jgi:predicted nucleic acid-binding protein
MNIIATWKINMTELRVLLDANILLDVLARREPFYNLSAGLWACIETGQAQGLVAAHCVTTLYYLIVRHTNRSKAILAINDLLRVFSVATVNQAVIYQALAMNWRDFEDAVQVCAAAQARAHYLITRNAANFTASPVPVLGPSEFLALLAAGAS